MPSKRDTYGRRPDGSHDRLEEQLTSRDIRASLKRSSELPVVIAGERDRC